MGNQQSESYNFSQRHPIANNIENIVRNIGKHQYSEPLHLGDSTEFNVQDVKLMMGGGKRYKSSRKRYLDYPVDGAYSRMSGGLHMHDSVASADPLTAYMDIPNNLGYTPAAPSGFGSRSGFGSGSGRMFGGGEAFSPTSDSPKFNQQLGTTQLGGAADMFSPTSDAPVNSVQQQGGAVFSPTSDAPVNSVQQQGGAVFSPTSDVPVGQSGGAVFSPTSDVPVNSVRQRGGTVFSPTSDIQQSGGSCEAGCEVVGGGSAIKDN